jgi:hypothetical protein
MFSARAARALERVAFVASLLAGSVVVVSAGARAAAPLAGAGTLVALAVFYAWLARRWDAEWLVYGAEIALIGAYFYLRAAHPLPESLDAVVLLLFCFVEFGVSQALERLRVGLYARPTFYFSLLMPLVPLAVALSRGQLDGLCLLIVFSTATFYGVVCQQKEWKEAGYVATGLYNAFLWLAWARLGWRLSEHPQFYLIPVGVSAILFAEVNRRELGRQTVNAIRGIGSMVIYVSTAIPMWQFHSFGTWLTLLLLSLAGIFAGIGLRAQSFLWLGLVCFLFDVLYPLGRAGMEDVLARWGIMLGLGILLVLFVALNEKQRIVATLREYYEEVRGWE